MYYQLPTMYEMCIIIRHEHLSTCERYQIVLAKMNDDLRKSTLLKGVWLLHSQQFSGCANGLL